ncbi:hypothetical protein ACFV42_23500 [Streptomyces solisilvae]|uniref:hypothetical protein n=1 Tax=Streptomyces malaysiensis TaxID=92644 RepID=UPI003679FF6E
MSITGDPEELAHARAGILQSLDRCRHGRHETNRCLECPDGLSEGNPYLKAGQKIGFDAHGDVLYVPGPEDFNDAGAWRTPPVDIVVCDDPVLSRVYRELNRLVAGYTYWWPSVICPAPNCPRFWIVHVCSPAGQMSWHIPPQDMDLFGHVRRVDTWEQDTHSTEEKYRRLESACAAVPEATA